MKDDIDKYFSSNTELVRIQSEREETIAWPNGAITDVHAKRSHKQMEDSGDDDLVTDALPGETFILSDFLKIDKKNAEQYIIAEKIYPYSEFKKGKEPKEFDILKMVGFTGKKRKLTPAKMSKSLKSNIPVKKGDDYLTKITNEENRKHRLPYLEAIATMAEIERESEEIRREEGEVIFTPIYKTGGPVHSFAVNKAAFGGIGRFFGKAAKAVGNVAKGVADAALTTAGGGNLINSGFDDIPILRDALGFVGDQTLGAFDVATNGVLGLDLIQDGAYQTGIGRNAFGIADGLADKFGDFAMPAVAGALGIPPHLAVAARAGIGSIDNTIRGGGDFGDVLKGVTGNFIGSGGLNGVKIGGFDIGSIAGLLGGAGSLGTAGGMNPLGNMSGLNLGSLLGGLGQFGTQGIAGPAPQAQAAAIQSTPTLGNVFGNTFAARNQLGGRPVIHAQDGTSVPLPLPRIPISPLQIPQSPINTPLPQIDIPNNVLQAILSQITGGQPATSPATGQGPVQGFFQSPVAQDAATIAALAAAGYQVYDEGRNIRTVGNTFDGVEQRNANLFSNLGDVKNQYTKGSNDLRSQKSNIGQNQFDTLQGLGDSFFTNQRGEADTLTDILQGGLQRAEDNLANLDGLEDINNSATALGAATALFSPAPAVIRANTFQPSIDATQQAAISDRASRQAANNFANNVSTGDPVQDALVRANLARQQQAGFNPNFDLRLGELRTNQANAFIDTDNLNADRQVAGLTNRFQGFNGAIQTGFNNQANNIGRIFDATNNNINLQNGIANQIFGINSGINQNQFGFNSGQVTNRARFDLGIVDQQQALANQLLGLNTNLLTNEAQSKNDVASQRANAEIAARRAFNQALQNIPLQILSQGNFANPSNAV